MMACPLGAVMGSDPESLSFSLIHSHRSIRFPEKESSPPKVVVDVVKQISTKTTEAKGLSDLINTIVQVRSIFQSMRTSILRNIRIAICLAICAFVINIYDRVLF